MDSSKKYDNPSPEAKASYFSRIFFWWVLPFLWKGSKSDLETKDIHNVVDVDKSDGLGDQLEKHWQEEVQKALKQNRKPELSKAIRKTFWKTYGIYGVYIFLHSIVIKMLQPVVLSAYIKYYAPTSPRDPLIGWALAIGVVAFAFASVLVMHNTSLGCMRVGMRVRVACGSLVYRKLLRLNQKSLGQTAAGQLVNLLSNDLQRFDMASAFLHYRWIMPIQAGIAAFLMYSMIDFAAITGLLAITIQAVPVQGYLSELQGKLRYIIAKKTDARVKLMNEITSGIQVIKMYAWEKPFEAIVELARKEEIDEVTKTSYIKGFATGLMVYTERAILYISLITYVLMGHKLTGDIVFSLAQLINTVQLYMCLFYPLAISTLAEARVSIKRLEEFLMLEEREPEAILNGTDKIDGDSPGRIKLVKVNASWIPNPIVDTLIHIDLDVKPGTLCCVVGSVGAGKTSLLQLLLKELPLGSGKLDVTGNVAYASQEPWLFVSTVRNNILFGQPYVKSKYHEVIKVCALEKDFELLPHGDKTMVGERGVSLSGGQRARINLARAVYRTADVYLFDDPLSAVDAHVGKQLFEECLKKYLAGKTRVLVTHQIHFLKQADLIVMMNNGKIEKIGTFAELSERELEDIVSEPEKQNENELEVVEEEKRERLLSVNSHTSSVEEEDEPQETDDLMVKGKMSSKVYTEYIKASGGICWMVTLVLLLLVAQACCNISDLWIGFWSDVEEERSKANNTVNITNPSFGENATLSNDTLLNDTLLNDTLPLGNFFNFWENDTLPTQNSTLTIKHDLSQNDFIYVYTFFIVLSVILTNGRSFLFFRLCMVASKGLHKKMFNNVLKAPMRFFDTNPSGRILTRFSKDMGVVDETLPKAMLDATQIFLVMTGILTMVFIKVPWMIAVAVVLSFLFYRFRTVYLATAQGVMRLEGASRAPVYSHMSATLHGIGTIRSAKAQQMIIEEFDRLQDQQTGAWFLYLANSECFGFYLDVISTLFLAIVTFQFLIFDDGTNLSGSVGLVISQSLILTGMLQHGVRQTAEVASNMTSVERILQYTKLTKEGPFESLPANKPPLDWPSSGNINFKKTYLRYAPEEPPVLKNLNVTIEAGEKIGIVGRTGAGKSTLIASLFRLAKIEGSIEIDGVDTESVGLEDLRKNISIIPQEPVLFSATVRYNLDPFDKCEDNVLWEALENVELKDAVQDLGQEVSEGGSNFSAGQRQLVCLARAIVRNNKILVMDEATANVDPNTDKLIQSTIRKAFKDCTVLTIAHRLNTIMDSDKVLVMDAGQAVEFDHPHILLQNREGFFAKMLEQTDAANELRSVAENAYKLKQTTDLEST